VDLHQSLPSGSDSTLLRVAASQFSDWNSVCLKGKSQCTVVGSPVRHSVFLREGWPPVLRHALHVSPIEVSRWLELGMVPAVAFGLPLGFNGLNPQAAPALAGSPCPPFTPAILFLPLRAAFAGLPPNKSAYGQCDPRLAACETRAWSG